MKKTPLLLLPVAAAAAALPAYGAAPAPTPRPPGGFAFGKVTEANGSRFVVQGEEHPSQLDGFSLSAASTHGALVLRPRGTCSFSRYRGSGTRKPGSTLIP